MRLSIHKDPIGHTWNVSLDGDLIWPNDYNEEPACYRAFSDAVQYADSLVTGFRDLVRSRIIT